MAGGGSVVVGVPFHHHHPLEAIQLIRRVAQVKQVIIIAAVQLHKTVGRGCLDVKRVAAGIALNEDKCQPDGRFAIGVGPADARPGINNRGHIVPGAQGSHQQRVAASGGDGQCVDAGIGAEGSEGGIIFRVGRHGHIDEGVAVINRGEQINGVIPDACVEVKTFQRGKADGRDAAALQAGGIEGVGVVAGVFIVLDEKGIAARIRQGIGISE